MTLTLIRHLHGALDPLCSFFTLFSGVLKRTGRVRVWVCVVMSGNESEGDHEGEGEDERSRA